jgi:hypothetical protein
MGSKFNNFVVALATGVVLAGCGERSTHSIEELRAAPAQLSGCLWDAITAGEPDVLGYGATLVPDYKATIAAGRVYLACDEVIDVASIEVALTSTSGAPNPIESALVAVENGELAESSRMMFDMSGLMNYRVMNGGLSRSNDSLRYAIEVKTTSDARPGWYTLTVVSNTIFRSNGRVANDRFELLEVPFLIVPEFLCNGQVCCGPGTYWSTRQCFPDRIMPGS